MSIPKASNEAEHRGDGRGEGQTGQGLIKVVTSGAPLKAFLKGCKRALGDSFILLPLRGGCYSLAAHTF